MNRASLVATRHSGRLVLAVVALQFCSASVAAQQPVAKTDYQTPAQVLVDIVDAPLTPSVLMSPDHEWMLLQETPSLPPLAELAERELRLAGLRINPQTNGRSRRRPFTGLRFLRTSDSRELAVTGLPERPRLGNVSWAPDGERVLFTHTTSSGIELWVADITSGRARRLTEPVLNLTAADPPAWMSDSRTIITTVVPKTRAPAEPAAPAVPSGPTVQENVGKTVPARTYQDLLSNAYDEALFEYYATAQLAKVTVDGDVTILSEPGIIWSQTPAPNGMYILVETVHRPYSYLVPAYRFPTRIEVIDLQGNPVHLVADLPLQEGVPVPFGSVPVGPRSVSWRSDAPASLYWVEALDDGDAGKPADERDRVFMLAAPFTGDPMPLITLGLRYAGLQWGTDDLALVWERWWRTRQVRTWVVRPGRADTEPRALMDRSYEDRYSDQGTPMMMPNAMGAYVLRTANRGRTLFMSGSGASPEGDRPFLDRMDVRTGQTERLFQSEAPYYERPIDVLDDAGRQVLTMRESQQDPPNYFVRDLRRNRVRQVTSFPNPTPQLDGMHKELVRYQRSDGVDLQATLYLPPGYDAARDGPLPTFVWAYPREFKSADAASQVSGSPHRFTRLTGWSTPLWAALGYAVLDGATMPIVGAGEAEPNDTYVEQLVASAQAAIDEAVRRGVADPARVAIGGHSYGAFMTANLLTHSDLFAAGIARSGAYNRSLTPFGFQAEERTFWEAPDVYFRMSPFMNAEKVNEPILLIHGEADNNSGTFPIQSQRYYHALKGLGATARLVMLPYESHGYRARESILHMLWEMQEWLDRYVKKAVPSEPRVSGDEGY
ncbi:MAG: prolyl oligopeptidase family serine peptidase [Gemmatimonadota bacterium]|nr:prolyl oligopeptidase family serine peptidase [Gemmatimonadota bacterium]